MLETPIERESTPENSGGLLNAYPYAFAIAGVVIFVLAGAFVVQRRLATNPPPPQTGAWSGNIQILLGSMGGAAPQEASQQSGDLMHQVQGNAPYTYKIPTLTPQPSAPSKTPPVSAILPNDAFNYDAFLALLSHSATGTEGPNQDSAVQSAYSYIPSGFISTSTRTKKFSNAQEDLYNYGNDIGSILQTFETNHSNQTQVLTDQMRDPQDPAKVAAAIKIGTDLEKVGRDLESMDTVPPQMQAVHAALAKSYGEMGRYLALVPTTKTPRDLLRAVYAYNASADAFAQNFVAMATIFSANDVSFAPEDTGSVFMFTNTVGL